MSDTFEAKCHFCAVSFNDTRAPDYRPDDVAINEIERTTQYGEMIICSHCDDRLEEVLEAMGSPDLNLDNNSLRAEIRSQWADEGAILDEAS